MSARVWLASGVTVESAGPVVFDPPVKITRSGFYTLLLEGGEPTLEPVAEPWWVELEQAVMQLHSFASAREPRDGEPGVYVADVLAAIERVRDRR